MDYEEWVETYKPVKNHLDDNASMDGTMFETYGEEREHILIQHDNNPEKVWTLVQGDSGAHIIIEGFHYVNRLGYFITEESYEGDYIEILVGDPDEDEEDEECSEDAIDN